MISLERLPREYGKNRRRIEISKIRGADYIDGYHDYTIARGGMSIFPRLESHYRPGQFNDGMISSGLPNLDDILGGGLDRGRAALIVGPAACGKIRYR